MNLERLQQLGLDPVLGYKVKRDTGEDFMFFRHSATAGGWEEQNHRGTVLSPAGVLWAMRRAAEMGHTEILAWHCCCAVCSKMKPEIQRGIKRLQMQGEFASSGIAQECRAVEFARVRKCLEALPSLESSSPLRPSLCR